MRPLPALFFLAISTWTGRRLFRALLPDLDGGAQRSDSQRVGRWVIGWPAAFLGGTLLVTWATYLTADLMRDTISPMAVANGIVLTVLGVALLVSWLTEKNRIPEKRLP